MFLKLPGLNSYHRGVRIFSRIYYVFLALLFCFLLIRDRSGMSLYDTAVNISEMFIFWLAFVLPVFVAVFMDKRGFGKAEISIVICIVMMAVIAVSMKVGTLYSEKYKAEYGDSSSVYEDALQK